MKYIVSINDKNYEVEVEHGEAKIIKTTKAIQIDAAQPAVQKPAVAQVQTQAPVAVAANISGEGEPIKAPLPGVILSIKANAGAPIKKGEIILILEAMKMENEIVAPRDGVITQIVAAKGSSVNTGDVLVVLK